MQYLASNHQVPEKEYFLSNAGDITIKWSCRMRLCFRTCMSVSKFFNSSDRTLTQLSFWIDS